MPHAFIMPAEWVLSVVVLVFKGKGDILNCGNYRVMKLLEHNMKVMERLLEKSLCRIVTVVFKIGFIPEKGTICVVFILRKLQEEYSTRGKSFVCVVDLSKLLTEYQGKCWNGH